MEGQAARFCSGRRHEMCGAGFSDPVAACKAALLPGSGKAAAFGLTGSKTRSHRNQVSHSLAQTMVAAAGVAEVIFRPVPKVTWTNRDAD